ncbi:hypothetical protein MNBD_ALPHA09-1453 [hydrothermal vent metagenome]|uniref:ATP synthase protein I n=1 Tax=hydrothermal vent metagenome TaxID=652676 RepID=A0A3B0TCE1_9ZZZZ
MKKRREGHPPSNADHRLDNLETKLRDVRKQHKGPEQGGRRGTQLGFAFRLATELVAGFVVGGLIGWQLDTWFGTLPLFLLIFFGLGAAAGILNVVRTAKAMNETARQDGSADEPSKRR